MSCTVSREAYTADILQKTVKTRPVFTKIDVLSDTSLNPQQDSITTHNSVTPDSDILTGFFDNPSYISPADTETFYFKAHPSSQNEEFQNNYGSLFLGDSVTVDSSRRLLKIQLSHSLYQTVPSLQNSSEVLVGKIKSSKRGHGTQKYATYAHYIDVSPYDKLSSQDKLKVAYILRHIFDSVTIHETRATTVVDKQLSSGESNANSYEVNSKNCAVSKVLAPSDFAAQLALADPAEAYEYLTLLLLNSLQLAENIDDYISSYQSPVLTSSAVSYFHKTSLSADGFSSLLIRNFEAMDWKVVSMHTGAEHILLLKEDKEVFIWRVVS